jgi:hypothetical protein
MVAVKQIGQPHNSVQHFANGESAGVKKIMKF